MTNLDLDILRKKIQGRLTADEEIDFMQWLQASEANREYFNWMRQYHNRSFEELDLELVPDTTDMFMQRLKRRSRRARLLKVIQYAAVILMPLLIGAAIWFYTDTKLQKELASQSVKEENIDQTVLITSNGESYELESGIEQAVVEDHGVKIRKYLRAGIKYDNRKNSIKQLAYNTLKTANGDDYRVELSDGTVVYLNGGSELRYPVNFGAGDRKVELKGEAFFEVSKTGKAFFVASDKVMVRVMGTRFNVKAYADEEAIQTTLVSGKVKVFLSDKPESQGLILTPGMQANWHRSSEDIEKRKVNTQLYTSWVDGYFRFENESLDRVMSDISRWYDVKVFYQNPELKKKRLTGKINRSQDFRVIADMIEKISGIKISKEKKAVVISMK